MFDKWFGKDPIFEMDIGYSFKYKKKIWEVIEVHEYSWTEGKSREYKVLSNGQEAFLEVEVVDDEVICLFGYEIKKQQILPDFTIEDFKSEEVLAELDFMAERYELNEISEGTYRNLTKPEGKQRLTSFSFYRKNDFVAIVLWEDNTMEFSEGMEVSRKKIKDIEGPSSGHASDNNLFS